MTGTAVGAIEREGAQVIARGSGSFHTEVDLVAVATKVRPSTALGESAGVDRGASGALHVNRAMETNVSDTYAVGDCAETWSQQWGRVVGENGVGGRAEHAGSLGTQAVEVFDLVAARTGLRDEEASEAEGIDPLTAQLETWDHKLYYPGPHAVHIHITGDRQTWRLLGAQMSAQAWVKVREAERG